MVLSRVEEVLSTEAFESILQINGASEVRDSFVSTFKENCQDQFESLLEKHELVERLHELDSEMRTSMTINDKRRLKPLEAKPQDLFAALQAEHKTQVQLAMESQLKEVLNELDAERSALETTRKRAKLVLVEAKSLQDKFTVLLGEGEADTEDEE